MTVAAIPSASQLAEAIVVASWTVGVDPAEILTGAGEEAWTLAWTACAVLTAFGPKGTRWGWRALNMNRRPEVIFLPGPRHRQFRAAFSAALGLEAA